MIQRIVVSLFLLTSTLTLPAQASHFDCSNLLIDTTRAAVQRILHTEEPGVSVAASVETALRTYLNSKSMPDLLELLRQNLPAVTTPNAGRTLFNQMNLSRHAISFDMFTEPPRLLQRTFLNTNTVTLSLLENDIQSILYFSLSNGDRVSLVLSADGKIIFNTQVSSLTASKQLAQTLTELGFGTTPESSALLLGIRNLGIMSPTIFNELLYLNHTVDRTLELAQQSLNQRRSLLELDYADEYTEVSVVRGASITPQSLRALVDGRKNYIVLNEVSQSRMILVEYTPLGKGIIKGIMVDYGNEQYQQTASFKNTLTTVEGPYAIDHLVWLVNLLTTHLTSHR